jgi:hypothetical protein
MIRIEVAQLQCPCPRNLPRSFEALSSMSANLTLRIRVRGA